MDKIYIIAGIEGMPTADDKNVFSIDRIVARDMLSGDDGIFTIDEIVDNDIEILGLPSWFLKDCYDLNSMYYNVNECKFDGSGDSYDVGLLPIYYSDNSSRMPDYRYDIEDDTEYYLGDIDSSSVANESIIVSLYVEKDDDDYSSRCKFSALLSLSGGIEIRSEIFDYDNYKSNTFDSNGNILAEIYDRDSYTSNTFNSNRGILKNAKYFLSSAFGIYDDKIYDDKLEKLKNSWSVFIKEGDRGQVTEFITDGLHIVNASYLPEGATIITSNKCKVLVMCSNQLVGRRNNWTIVVSPSVVKILTEQFVDYYSLETKNIKLFISSRIGLDNLIDFVKTFTFRVYAEHREAIGFSEFNENDMYKPKISKCIEITDILDSNDTSNKLFNDIGYLVSELNQIGFNIELY